MSGLVLCVFQPRSPAIIPEPDSVIQAARATKSDIIFCVPSFVEVGQEFFGTYSKPDRLNPPFSRSGLGMSKL